MKKLTLLLLLLLIPIVLAQTVTLVVPINNTFAVNNTINFSSTYTSSLFITENIISYYKLDETSGVILDSVNGIHNGSVVEPVGYALARGFPGILDNSINVSATESGLAGAHVNFTTPQTACMDFNCTISAWVNFTTRGNRYIYYQGSADIDNANHSSILVSSGKVVFQFENATGTNHVLNSANNQNNSQWQHVVAVMNTTDMLLYVNGTLDSFQGLNSTAINIQDFRNLIGGGASNTGGVTDIIQGGIDELGIWNSSLTSAEILTLFNSGNAEPFTSSISTLSNLTLNIFNTDGSLFLANFTELTGRTNQTSWISSFVGLIPRGYLWNAEACLNNASCVVSQNNFSFIQGLSDQIQNLTPIVYETELSPFNVSFNTTGTPSGFLWWNGTRMAGTATQITGNLWRLTADFQLGTSPTEPIGTKNVFWEIITGLVRNNQTVLTQTFSPSNFTICGTATQNVPYINLTYYNETTAQENVGAEVTSSTWTYYRNVITTNKTLSFSDSSMQLNHTFCFSPSNKPITVDLQYSFKNDYSQQRIFGLSATTLTNVTSNNKLFLLPDSQGLFSKFQAITRTGAPVSDVKATITRTLGGGTITVTTAFTDDSGFVNFFLDPDITYTATFQKAGFAINTFTFVPTTELRSVLMGGGADVISNGTQIASNTTYIIAPTESHLQNNTDILFQFNVTSTQPITRIFMNITNGTHQFGTATFSGISNISTIVNTGTNKTIVGYFTIETSGEAFTVTRVWSVGPDFIGRYSIFRQFEFFNDYEFNDFIRILIVLASITGVLIFLSTKELLDSSESKIITALLLIWGFSIVGWLNTGIVANEALQFSKLAVFGNQYGIAMLTTGVAVFFVFRRVFIRRI